VGAATAELRRRDEVGELVSVAKRGGEAPGAAELIDDEGAKVRIVLGDQRRDRREVRHGIGAEALGFRGLKHSAPPTVGRNAPRAELPGASGSRWTEEGSASRCEPLFSNSRTRRSSARDHWQPSGSQGRLPPALPGQFS